MWKYNFNFNCNGPLIIEAGNLNEAKQFAEILFGCGGGCCEYLGCDPSPLCSGGRKWKPSRDFIRQAADRTALLNHEVTARLIVHPTARLKVRFDAYSGSINALASPRCCRFVAAP